MPTRRRDRKPQIHLRVRIDYRGALDAYTVGKVCEGFAEACERYVPDSFKTAERPIIRARIVQIRKKCLLIAVGLEVLNATLAANPALGNILCGLVAGGVIEAVKFYKRLADSAPVAFSKPSTPVVEALGGAINGLSRDPSVTRVEVRSADASVSLSAEELSAIDSNLSTVTRGASDSERTLWGKHVRIVELVGTDNQVWRIKWDAGDGVLEDALVTAVRVPEQDEELVGENQTLVVDLEVTKGAGGETRGIRIRRVLWGETRVAQH